MDGCDVQAVSDVAGRLVAEIRAGGGPRLLHALTDRHKGHVSVDPATYRKPEDLAAALQRDALARARQRLDEMGHGAAADTIEREARAEIDAAVASAKAAPLPDATAAYTDIQDIGHGIWA